MTEDKPLGANAPNQPKRVAIGPPVTFGVACAALLLVAIVPGGTVEHGSPEPGWIALVSSSPEDLVDTSSRAVRRAIAALNSIERTPAQRIDEYRRHLTRAETLLAQSLAARPAHAATLLRFAAVHWEKNPPTTPAEMQNLLAAVRLAGDLSPHDADVQRRAAKLLIRFGARDRALAYFRNALELEPRSAPVTIRIMRENFLTLEEIVSAIPPLPACLVALEAAFVDDGRWNEYADILRPHLTSAPDVIAAFSRALLREGDARRLLSDLGALDRLADATLEVERRIQTSRALRREGRLADALAQARAASDLAPTRVDVLENLGRIALTADRPGEATQAFRAALHEATRQGVSTTRRAALYRWIGQADERAGQPDRAYDAYRQALRLDPSEAFAARRVAEMENTAGTAGPPRGDFSGEETARP